MITGILTFHFAYNYGAMLQAYALSSKLNEYGIENEIIDYRPRHMDYLYHPSWKDLLIHPKTILENEIRKKIGKADFSEFEDFLKCKLNLGTSVKSTENKDEILKRYNTIIVGSDQVWNPLLTNKDEFYLLKNFTDSITKISYAASIGVKEFDEDWKNKMQECLRGFCKISVREIESKKILDKMELNKEVVSIPDPVFLLHKNDWAKIQKKVDVSGKYILFYSLNMGKQIQEYALQLKEKYDLPVIGIHPLFRCAMQECESRSDIGPQQFLWLIDHAEFVCTDSFHATAFSMIFRKRVVTECDWNKGGRIPNLLNQLKLNEQYTNYQENKIPYYLLSEDSEVFDVYTEKGTEYLKECVRLIEKKGMKSEEN